ncbi:GNAT family N-acetyltransferase [Pleurocapsa sp. PCC 7319]|uniref:GNAT family N-acetyltransferase n=1 Tax=Pleurocapsa sp. PCC 7319 TaxID=118161 RepID=UPI00034C820C|nr:GNAT family N-acetyltransferase [Pleurocapsa sp. PCC 7319]
MIVIETPRLILRHLTLEDTEALASIYADPIVMKFFRSVRSPEVTKQKIEKIIESYEQDGFGLWATIYKPDNQFIGRCGLIPQIVNQCSELEIAYLLAKEYWGRGLATEAAIAIKNYGFEEIGCNRLISLINHDNIASQKVALKTGLTYEKDIQMEGENLRVYAIARN